MNLNAAVNPKLDLSLSSGFINLKQRFSLESNATAGLGSQVFGGRVQRLPSGPTPGSAPPLNPPLQGYRAWTPGYTWQEKNEQRVNRTIIQRQRELAPDEVAAESHHGRQRLRRPRGRSPPVQRRRAADHGDLS